MKRGDGGDVTGQQHRQHHAGRVARPEQECEDDDMDEADAREAGLADADAGSADDGERPLE
jgi:hypothetical protein